MDDDCVYNSQEFTEAEWQLVDQARRTLNILTKVIEHRSPQAVKNDIDPDGEMAEEVLDALVEQHRTPDLRHLTAGEVSMVIGQLGPIVFAELAKVSEPASSVAIDGNPG